MHQFYIGGRFRGRYLRYSHCNGDDGDSQFRQLNVRIMASYHLLPVFDASNHQLITFLQYDITIIYRQLVYGEIFTIRPLQSGVEVGSSHPISAITDSLHQL